MGQDIREQVGSYEIRAYQYDSGVVSGWAIWKSGRQVQVNIVSREVAIDVIRRDYEPAPIVAPTAARTTSTLATERQVSYAWSLTCRAYRSGADLGKEISDLQAMTRGEISAYIDMLKEQY